jgi:hypothetical protein
LRHLSHSQDYPLATTQVTALDSSSWINNQPGQTISATGKPVFHFITTPIYSAGQNFALSPHGNRLAVLHNGAIEIYSLKPEQQISQ